MVHLSVSSDGNGNWSDLADKAYQEMIVSAVSMHEVGTLQGQPTVTFRLDPDKQQAQIVVLAQTTLRLLTAAVMVFWEQVGGFPNEYGKEAAYVHREAFLAGYMAGYKADDIQGAHDAYSNWKSALAKSGMSFSDEVGVDPDAPTSPKGGGS